MKNKIKAKPMSQDLKNKIVEGYQKYLLTEGERPKTVFAFCETIKIEEAQFYEHYANFESLEIGFWNELFERTIGIVKGDEAFDAYNARERTLAFYFTLIEQLKKNLSYFRLAFGNQPILQPNSPFAKGVKGLESFFNELIEYGEEQNEIAKRPMFKKLLVKGFQFHLVFVFKYFMKDTSQAFAKTDEAIEKSTNLLFDGLQKGVVDSAFDFAKFMGQNAFA
ncbi:MAG: TetR/AcrR family transcriptional regulator [Bacteroidetes bacterium]|nr:TetR/AcrR family transcriptional regulator [Bacteroidota bacterium]